MKKYLILLFLAVLSISSVDAQFGISSKYQLNSFKYDEIGYNDQSIEYGLNYWFRLKNKRVEFLPEVFYASAFNDETITFAPQSFESNQRTAYGLNLHTQIYPLDFEGDCNCPTFSKQGSFVEKGFHWIISPGIAYQNLEANISEGASPSETFTTSGVNFRMGMGLGLDIGLRDIVTISPFVIYNMDFGTAFPTAVESQGSLVQGNDVTNTIKRWNIGIRIMFRPDYVKQNGGFRRRR